MPGAINCNCRAPVWPADPTSHWDRVRPLSGRLRWFPAQTVRPLYRPLSWSSFYRPAKLPKVTRSAHSLDPGPRISAAFDGVAETVRVVQADPKLRQAVAAFGGSNSALFVIRGLASSIFLRACQHVAQIIVIPGTSPLAVMACWYACAASSLRPAVS